MEENDSREHLAPGDDAGAASIDDALTAALRAALAAPEDEGAWDQAEEIAASEERPELVAAAYREALSRALPPALASRLGERATRLHDEWFEDRAPLAAVLSRVLELDPSADWAFERLTMLYTVGEQWVELLSLYDRALERVTEPSRRAQLLEEAGRIAKDFAGRDDRAIHYLAQLFPLKPSDTQLAASLERLYEREERYRDLIDLWTSRLAVLPPDQARATRARISACWLDHLGQPAEALAAIEPLAEDAAADAVFCDLLERVLAFESAPTEVRRRALSLLKARHAQAERSADVVRVLGVALSFVDGAERIEAHREIAERLIAVGRDAEAVEHAALLVVLDPCDESARERLRGLAERTGAHERYADALASAADATDSAAERISLLVESARVRCEILADDAGAIALYARVLADKEAAPEALLGVARRLATLLDAAGRRAERLDVLERLADLEPDAAARADVLGRAARLADELGDAERALNSWRRRLDQDSEDAEALDATIDLYERTARWAELIAALRRRASRVNGRARREDLVRVARVQAEGLNVTPEAIETWREVEREFGADAESVDALSELLGAAQRWQDLAELLEGAASREEDAARRALLLGRLGDVCLERLGAPERAAGFYRDALRSDPADARARTRLRALLDDAACARVAASALAEAYAATDEWSLTLEILEPRLRTALDDASRTAILREAAAIQEQRAGDLSAALRSLRRALPYAPSDTQIESEMLRLAKETGEWTVAVEAYRDATVAAVEDVARVAQLLLEQATILEVRLGDLRAALDVYARVSAADPAHAQAVAGVVRCAGQVGEWPKAAAALVDFARATGRAEPALFAIVDEAACATDAWDAATTAIGEALASPEGLLPSVAREIETQLALWHRDRRSDFAAAEAALLRAIAHEGGHAETLRTLAALQRREPGAPLVQTLLLLADATGNDLASLFEAGRVALVALGGERTKPILERLLDEAARRWQSGEEALDASPAECASWALEELVRVHLEGSSPASAVDLLLRGACLPFDADAAREMRHRAAEVAAGPLGDAERAMEIYRRVLEDSPADARALARLAGLYEAAGRYADLLALRRHELALTESLQRRLELRLDVARVLGILGDRAGRIEALLANLDERPGHAASVAEISSVLKTEGEFGRLADVLSEQGARLEAEGDAGAAAELWARVAEIAEVRLGDVPRALDALRRVVSLAPTREALDALARLHTARDEHEEAVRWLERRLEMTDDAAEQSQTVVRLARAHAATGRIDRAIATLEAALAKDPRAADVRGLLFELYRGSSAWAPLATGLLAACDHVEDIGTQLGYLREAAEIYHRRLGAPESAVPILERAAALAPTDRSVRVALSDSLRAAGRLEEACAILETLIAEFGRRRPPERAAVHYQLAQIARARGALDEALAQLELASGMDMKHAGIFKMLGDLARETGQLERAERAYRALLLIMRNRTGSAVGDDEVSPSEVLFEIYRVAAQLGQTERAQEVLESGFETAARDEDEARRFERALRAADEPELLLRALKARLNRVKEPSAQAEVLAEISDVLAGGLGRLDEALDARLRALALLPGDAGLHEAASALALRAGRAERYADAVGEMCRAARDAGEGALACQLLLRFGEVHERYLGQPERAAEIYREAEQSGEHRIEVYRALERVYAALGDAAGQARVLRLLVDAEPEEIHASERTEALYRLAAIELGSDETRGVGVDSLSWALDLDPQYERAAAMLREALRKAPGDARVVALFERVARALGEDGMLLDALEYRVALADATVDDLREPVEIAERLGENERAVALLKRAVEIARTSSIGGLADAVWALVALGGRAKDAGDLASAVTYLRDAASVASEAEARELYTEVAAMAAGPLGDYGLAAEAYERLREYDPSDRGVWEPLMEVYRQLGDNERLEALIVATVDSVFDTAERNALRMERAKILLARPERYDDAVAALREVLDEDPGHAEAAAALAEIYEREGRFEDLAELLTRQLDAARDRSDAVMVEAISLRVGSLWEKAERRQDALDVYRAALEWAPESRSLLQAMLALYGPEDDQAERADVMERLLAIEKGPEAARLAHELVAVREAAGDEAGVERALEGGFRSFPTDAALRERLERFYTERSEWQKLAEMLVFDAGARNDPAEALGRLREAATVYLEKLDDPRAAADVLRRAREAAPGDRALLADLLRCLGAAGEHAMGVEEVNHALEHFGEDPTLLRARADLRAELGEHAAAVADLERAYVLGGADYAEALAAGLDRQRTHALDAGDREVERATTMRMVALYGEMGEGGRARELLAEWVSREPDDREALGMLAEADAAAGNWEKAAEAYARLVDVEQGAERISAALRLAEACERAGRPADAREGLERAFAEAPGDEMLRAHLRRLYEQTGAHRELAELMLSDAEYAPDDATRFERLRRAAEVFINQLGDPAAAIAPLEAALRLRAGDHDVTVLLADAYTDAGRIAEATQLLDAAVNAHKGRRPKELAVLQHRMARVAHAAGDRKIELAWLNVALDSDMQNGRVASELAEVALEIGETEIALKALRAVTLMKNPGPMSRAMAFLRQGQIAHQQGDPRKAIFLAKKALSEDPHLAEAEQFLREIGEN